MKEYRNLICVISGTFGLIFISLVNAVSTQSSVSCSQGFCSTDLFESSAANNLIIPLFISFSLLGYGMIRGYLKMKEMNKIEKKKQD